MCVCVCVCKSIGIGHDGSRMRFIIDAFAAAEGCVGRNRMRYVRTRRTRCLYSVEIRVARHDDGRDRPLPSATAHVTLATRRRTRSDGRETVVGGWFARDASDDIIIAAVNIIVLAS